jgi:hypothetical protein
MKLSHTLGMTACAALLAASGMASAATTIWVSNGYIVSTTNHPTSATDTTNYCGLYQQVVGYPSNTTWYLPATGGTGIALATSGITASTGVGGAVAYVGASSNTMPASLNKATLGFGVYGDSLAGPGANALIAITIAFATNTVGAPASNASVMNVESTETFTTGAPYFAPLCTAITDSTWIKE